jgi:glutamate/tyrosine decarboxylase-like PLP-dependent enzyme
LPSICARTTPIDARSLDSLRREIAEPLPHPEPPALRELCRQSADWLIHHFETLPRQSIGKTGTRAELDRLLGESAPEQGADFAAVLAEFAANVAPHAFRTNHPRFLAFVPGAPHFLSALGEFLCAGTNFFAGVWLEASGPAEVEIVVLEWFKDLLGYPAAARGILTGGGSEANLTALVVAREPLNEDQRRRAVLYLTEQRHWSADRAAKVMGLRPDQLRPVAVDANLRLQPAALAEAVRHDRAQGLHPWLVVANAGTTNTGTVDPLAALAECCRREGLWLHVDAAYGWAAALVEECRCELEGISEADSITLDPHKWFGQSFGVGCVLIREGRRLAETFTVRPAYLQDVQPADEETNFCDHGIALTRRFTALKIWLCVKTLGLQWFRNLARHCMLLADYAQRLLEESGAFEILCERQLSVVCFRYVPKHHAGDEETLDHLNLEIAEQLRLSGRAFISTTRLRDQVALRFCFVNWRTTAGDVEEIVRLLKEIGERLSP